MTTNKPFPRRRTHERYKIEDGKIGVANHHYIKTGYIYDISMGGLAFHYVDSGNAKNEFPFTSTLSITIKEKGFLLQEIAFKTISDIIIKPVFMEIRQRSVQFIEIPQEKQLHLKYLISDLTNEKIRDKRTGKERRSKSKRDIPQHYNVIQPPLPKQNRNERRTNFERRST
jgi:hypothetical protein